MTGYLQNARNLSYDDRGNPQNWNPLFVSSKTCRQLLRKQLNCISEKNLKHVNRSSYPPLRNQECILEKTHWIQINETHNVSKHQNELEKRKTHTKHCSKLLAYGLKAMDEKENMHGWLVSFLCL